MSASAVILGCILMVHADPPVNSYTIKRDSNGYDYSNSVNNEAYLGGKDMYRETGDFYTEGSKGHALLADASQGNLGGSLASNSYNGFSPSSHNGEFGGYTSTTRDNVHGNSYSLNGHAASSFGGFANSNGNSDSTFEGYATALNHAESDFNQYTGNSQKTPSHIGYTDNASGASTSGGYPEGASDVSAFRGYSGGSFKAPMTADYLDSGHAATGGSSYLFNNPSNDFLYGKHKESIFGMPTGNKYMNEPYSSATDIRYIRGNHGGAQMGREYGSPSMHVSNFGFSSPFTGMRGAGSNLYTSGKINKYGKYLGDYTVNAGMSYPSREPEADYASGSYNKGSGKIIVIKDIRPSSQAYPNGPYLSKVVGSYKNKPNAFMSYPGSNVGYSSMAGLQSNFGGSSYGDGHLVRGYRSSSKYAPGYGSLYSGYF